MKWKEYSQENADNFHATFYQFNLVMDNGTYKEWKRKWCCFVWYLEKLLF